MEPTEHLLGDENMEVWVGVPGLCRGKRWKPIQMTRVGKIDLLSDETASQSSRMALHLCAAASWVPWLYSGVSHTIEQQRR